jgi:hypothetical protein
MESHKTKFDNYKMRLETEYATLYFDSNHSYDLLTGLIKALPHVNETERFMFIDIIEIIYKNEYETTGKFKIREVLEVFSSIY